MSPTVFTKRGYRFFFFSLEETRMHVHVRSGDGEAKFWLEPDVQLAKNYRYTPQQLRQIQSIVEAVALHVNLDKTPSLRWETFAA